MRGIESIAELWLTAAGHSLWEHLDGEPIPWRKAAWDQHALSDPRAEALLCGLLYVWPEETKRIAARVGLQAWHFRDEDAAAVWRGEPRPEYQKCAFEEYLLTNDAIIDERIRMHLQGQQTPYHDATIDEVTAALAGRLVRIAEARRKLQEAEALLNEGNEQPATALGGVTL